MTQYGVQSLVLSVFHLCKVDQVCCDHVCIIVIITIFRSSQAVCLDLIISFEVSLQSFIQLLQCVFSVIEYQFPDGCHCICISCQTGPYNTRSEVVHRTACRYVPALFHTSFVHDGHQRLRRQISVHTL